MVFAVGGKAAIVVWCFLEHIIESVADAPVERFRHGVDLAKLPDTKGQLDDWKLVPSSSDSSAPWSQQFSVFFVIAVVGFGAWTRSEKVLPKDAADSLRRACFTLLLPAFLLRHIWLCQIDSQLYVVACWSFVLHLSWFGLSFKAAHALEPIDRQQRGWTILMSQGSMNSFLYPLLLANSRFGEKSLACAVLWDLGGNMWICQFALFAVAAFFRPGALGDEPLGMSEMDEVDPEENERLIQPKPHGRRFEEVSLKLEAITRGIPQQIIVDALKQPVLVCCVLGFLFNSAGVPLPWLIDTPLWAIGEPYKLALYFLVGYYGDYKVGSHDIGRIARALGTRYAISLSIIAMVLFVLPLVQMQRYTVALALLSPTSSYLIYLVGEHGYGENLLRLTVCGGFASTIISTFAQNVLVSSFAARLVDGG